MHTDNKSNFIQLLNAYLNWMQAAHFAEITAKKRRTHLKRFFKWCQDFNLENISAITKEHVETYQCNLKNLKDSKGKNFSYQNRNRHIIAIKEFFNFLSEKNYVLFNPAREVLLAREPKSLPSLILSPKEAEKLFSLADIKTPLGLRDRAIFEVFYATGIRRSELTGLTLEDIEWEGFTLRINKGKGKKDRVVPISKRALKWLGKYLEQSRPLLLADKNNRLFLNQKGQAINPEVLSTTVNNYFRKAGYEKGSCHVFRHSLATLMLENGVDTRYIQVMLGHENLVTTQIYTRVSIAKLKEVHSKTHPLAE